MGKVRGPQCCAFGCSKRKKVGPAVSGSRSDSEGPSDEESKLKENFQEHFISKQFFNPIVYYLMDQNKTLAA